MGSGPAAGHDGGGDIDENRLLDRELPCPPKGVRQSRTEVPVGVGRTAGAGGGGTQEYRTFRRAGPRPAGAGIMSFCPIAAFRWFPWSG